MSQLPSTDENGPTENLEEPTETPHELPGLIERRERLESTAGSIAQPDQEPEINSHPPSIEAPESTSEPELITEQLLCLEAEENAYFSTEHPDFAFRCEFDVPGHVWPPGDTAESDQMGWTLLASGNAKQRTEVKMSELTQQEKSLFEQAKQKEIDNWIQTNTITKVLKDQIPPEQVMRSRWT